MTFRDEMMERLIRHWEETGFIQDSKVLEAFRMVSRRNFVPKKLWDYTYMDSPIPIGYGQTISQPSIVALMTQALELKEDHKVLEIGAGSGYQTAILAQIVKKGRVIAIEILPELAERAKDLLLKLGIKNVELLTLDGSVGFAPEAPFDRIIITAASPRIPDQLFPQLKEGGIIVCPVRCTGRQELLQLRIVEGKVLEKRLCECIFVRLKGQYGFSEEEI